MKWYEYFDITTRERKWWTQRDKNGVCFEIRKNQITHLFHLLVCDEQKEVFQSLSAAQATASAMWEQ